jgi:hypothetical protein
MRHELLQLMKEFKVCYEIPHHRGNYIAPHLLQKDPPNYNWDTSQNLILRYRYKIFMPMGILSRFIVEMHQKIENVSDPDRALVWKYGVVLNRGNTRAEVTERTHDREIRIRLSGSGQKDFLTIINHEFDNIHARFENRLEYDTLIPCNCTKCKTLTEPYTYPLEELKRFVDNKQTSIQCYKSFELVNIRRLLDDSIDIDRNYNIRELRDGIEDRQAKAAQPAIYRYALPTGSSQRDKELFKKQVELIPKYNPNWIVDRDHTRVGEDEAILIIHKDNHLQNEVGYILTRSLSELLEGFQL